MWADNPSLRRAWALLGVVACLAIVVGGTMSIVTERRGVVGVAGQPGTARRG